MRRNYTLCDNDKCPLRESCARFLEDLDRRTVIHFDPHPYDEEKKRCNFYVHDALNLSDYATNEN